MATAKVFEHREFGRRHLVGVVTLAPDGKALIPAGLGPLSTMPVFESGTMEVIPPEDGERYIRALPYALHGAYVWAEIDEP